MSVEECENEVRDESLVAEIGEPYRTDYEMFDISDSGESLPSSSLPQSSYRSETEVTVNTALIARIEALESENYHLKKQMSMSTKERHFQLEQICDNDEDVRFYTGMYDFIQDLFHIVYCCHFSLFLVHL